MWLVADVAAVHMQSNRQLAGISVAAVDCGHL